MPAIGMVRPVEPTDAQKKTSDERINQTQARQDNLLTSKIGPSQSSVPKSPAPPGRPDR